MPPSVWSHFLTGFSRSRQSLPIISTSNTMILTGRSFTGLLRIRTRGKAIAITPVTCVGVTVAAVRTARAAVQTALQTGSRPHLAVFPLRCRVGLSAIGLVLVLPNGHPGATAEREQHSAIHEDFFRESARPCCHGTEATTKRGPEQRANCARPCATPSKPSCANPNSPPARSPKPWSPNSSRRDRVGCEQTEKLPSSRRPS